jgi:F0F1-type ATP synthase assembly protein I
LDKNGIISKANKGFATWTVGTQLALKFMVMLLCPIFSGVVCGLWLDLKWQTAPCLLMLFMLLGFTFSVYAVYRVATRDQQSTRSRKKEI